MTQSKNGPKNYTDISPRKIYRWLTNTWKDAQHHLVLEKCKTKLMRYHLTLVRMAAIKKFTNNAGEGVEKRKPSYTVGGNAN